MTQFKEKIDTEIFVNYIIEGIEEKKGLEIVCLDLSKFNIAICDYFIICHGTSRTHVGAIAESVEEFVKKHTGCFPSRREGVTNAEWILLDYLDVVVHVFQEEVRDHYKLEDLWADAPFKNIETFNIKTT